jgi:pseudouridine-5'-phosphate glycosidase
VGFGTDELPAFYTRSSGLALEHRVDEPAMAARLIRARRALGDRGGVLIANPIPEEAELPRALVDGAIEQALAEAERASVRGKRLTPFLLSRIAEATRARSLVANRALVLSNARLAARIAVALATQEARDKPVS